MQDITEADSPKQQIEEDSELYHEAFLAEIQNKQQLAIQPQKQKEINYESDDDKFLLEKITKDKDGALMKGGN